MFFKYKLHKLNTHLIYIYNAAKRKFFPKTVNFLYIVQVHDLTDSRLFCYRYNDTMCVCIYTYIYIGIKVLL